MLAHVVFYFLVFNIFLASFAWSQTQTLSTPNVSANVLFLYRNTDSGKEDASTLRNGFDLRETELAFYSDVDPYHRLNILLSIHPEYTYNATTERIDQAWKIEPEELFAESLQIPSITLKLGKFKAAVGKQNQLHTHSFLFVEAPLINTTIMGDEGLNDTGISAAGLLPFSWFSEITTQWLRGEGENTQFSSQATSDGVLVLHLKNLFDLNEESTFELGNSYAQGKNDLRGNTSISGLDLTYKYRPTAGGLYRSFLFGGEWLMRNLDQTGTASEKVSGYFSFAKFQFAQRWSVLAAYDNLQIQNSNATFNSRALANNINFRSTLGVNFNSTEFSAYKVEYSWGPEKKIFLQANFTIGAHPTHSY